MLFSPSANLAFYHIHKTGGTSFKFFLGTLLHDLEELDPWPHHSLEYYLTLLRKRGVEAERVQLCTLVRHPGDHAVSVYYFWQQERKIPPTMTFAEFIPWYVSSKDPDCRVYPELLLLDGELPKNLAMLRLENIERDTDRLLNRELAMNVQIAIPRLNATEHRSWLLHYDRQLALLIRERYRWIFEAGMYADEALRSINRTPIDPLAPVTT